MGEPARPIRPGGNPEVSLRDGSQHQAYEQRWPLPIELDHEPTEGAENQHHDHVAETVFDGESAKINQQEKERDKQGSSYIGDFCELLEKKKTDRNGNDVGNDNDPDEGEGKREMLGRIQHVGARHDPLDQERAEQDRRGDAARDAKGNRGNQIPSSGRVIGCSGAEHSFHGTFAETLFVRGALNRVGVCHPLRRAASHSWKYADVRAQSAALENQPPVAEGVFHSLHDSAQLCRLAPGRCSFP